MEAFPLMVAMNVRRTAVPAALWALAVLASSLLLAVTATAQSEPSATSPAAPAGERPTVLHAYKLENQPATEALALVYPLLSPIGTVELKPRENTLVIRDVPAAVEKIVPVLSRFDHPKRAIDLEIQMVRATAEQFSPPPRNQLPAALQRRLEKLLPYHSYELLASTRLASKEGDRVSYRLGQRFDVRFRLGTVLEGRRIRLHDFEVDRAADAEVGQAGGREAAAKKTLIHTNLFLFLDQTFSLGLAPSESSREALMVVITARIAPGQDLGGFGVPSPSPKN